MINYILLFIATIFWGLGFIGTRWTFEAFDPLWAHGLRFLFSGVIILPFLFLYKKKLYAKEAFIASLFLGSGMIFQTFGLKYTTIAKSGFLTTLYVIFTPLILGLLKRRGFSRIFWTTVFMALIGMAFLCELSLESFNRGDVLTIFCAFVFSLHIIYVGEKASELNPFLFNGLQCLFMGLVGVLLAGVFEGMPNLEAFNWNAPDFNVNVIYGFFIGSILAALIAFTIQVQAQKKIPAHVVGMTFLLESPFATFFGYVFFDEKLTYLSMIGAGLIFLALCLLIWSRRFE